MELTIIAALSKNRVIGNKGEIPWHIPEDLKRFRKLTLGHPVIMGRKTYESIIKRLGHPLDRRVNIVLSRQEKIPEIITANSIEDAIKRASEYDNLAYVIGGQSVYEQTINLADRMELTEVRGEFEGDAFFPVIDYDEWNLEDTSHMRDCVFLSYIRKK